MACLDGGVEGREVEGSRVVLAKNNTTRKLRICGGPIAAGTKTAAIGHLLRRIFGPPLYMRSIAAVYMPASIALVFCGVL